jgi:hypothetical protein
VLVGKEVYLVVTARRRSPLWWSMPQARAGYKKIFEKQHNVA